MSIIEYLPCGKKNEKSDDNIKVKLDREERENNAYAFLREKEVADKLIDDIKNSKSTEEAVRKYKLLLEKKNNLRKLDVNHDLLRDISNGEIIGKINEYLENLSEKIDNLEVGGYKLKTLIELEEDGEVFDDLKEEYKEALEKINREVFNKKTFVESLTTTSKKSFNKIGGLISGLYRKK